MKEIETWQEDNRLNIANKAFPAFLGFSLISTGSSETILPFRAKKDIKLKPCVLILFNEENLSQHSESLIDIDNIIAQYTATKEGKQKWAKAEKELNDELYQEVLSGKMNKIKYYRIINKMDQKTLAELSQIKQPNISRIENLGYIADNKTYMKIAKVFGISYKELLP
jgi:DNA-binding XRE family transcriptional regulator